MDPESPFLGKSRHLTHQVSSKLERNVKKIQNLTLDNIFGGGGGGGHPTQQFWLGWHSPTPALVFCYQYSPNTQEGLKDGCFTLTEINHFTGCYFLPEFSLNLHFLVAKLSPWGKLAFAEK